MDKKIHITDTEFNAIVPQYKKECNPHTLELSCFRINLNPYTGISIVIKDINKSLNWFNNLIKNVPCSASKDVLTICDKLFLLNNEGLK